MNLLKGYKTYILAFIGICWAIYGYWTGFIDGEKTLEVLWLSLTAGALRHGISIK